jgi:predicted nuclease with TOPRIM domain
MRKKAGLIPSDLILISVNTDKSGEALINKFKNDLAKTAGLKDVLIGSASGEKIKIGESIFIIEIRK